MNDTTFLHLEDVSARVVAKALCEKLGAREAQVIEQELRAVGPRCAWKMALNLSEVQVIASMGLGMLVSIHKSCKEQKGVLAIFGLRKDIQDVLAVTQLHKVLRLVDSREAALKVIQ